MLMVVVLATLALVVTFGSGYLWLRAWTNMSEAVCWCLAGVAGAAECALIGLLLFLLGKSSSAGLCIALTTLVAAASLYRMIQRGNVKVTLPPWLIGVLLWWCGLVATQAVVPVYAHAFFSYDWWMHFDIVEFYRGLRDPFVQYAGYTIPSRTPLFNLAGAYYLTVFGDSFAMYQLTALIYGIGLFGVLVLFVPSHWSILLLLVALNSFLTTHVLYPWPKILATALMMAGVWCYLQWRDEPRPHRRWIFASGLWAGLAVMTHTGMVVYVAALAIDYVYLNRSRLSQAMGAIGWGGVAIALPIIPWVAWVAGTYGASRLLTAAPTVSASGGSDATTWLIDRLLNLFGTLFPLSFVMEKLRVTGWWDSIIRYWYGTLPGACMTVALVLWLKVAKRGAGPLPRSLVRWIVGIGFFGSILLQPGQIARGIASENMTMLVAILVVLLAAGIPALSPRARRIGLTLLGVEFLLSRGLHTALLAFGKVSPDDPNILLKQEMSIVFLRDQLGSAWGIVGGLLILSYGLLIAWLLWSWSRATHADSWSATLAGQEGA
jgi:hypothetical protein